MILNLQNSEGKNLPDFFGEIRPDRIRITLDEHVKSLISSDLLLDVSLNTLLNDLLSLSIEIENTIVLLSCGTKEIPLDPIKVKKMIVDQIFEYAKKQSRKLSEKEIETYIDTIFNSVKTQFLNAEHNRLLEKINSINNEIQNKLSDYCTEKKIPLDILDRNTLFLCKKCRKIYRKDIFQRGICDCKETISAVEQTDQLPIVHVGIEVRNFVVNNMWLEYGVNKLYENSVYKTACGAQVIGASGVKHEIDLICENPDSLKRILVECKNKDLGLNEIFILYGKMSDLGCNYGIIITTGTASHPNVLRMAQSKNIVIVEKVLEQKRNNIIAKIT